MRKLFFALSLLLFAISSQAQFRIPDFEEIEGQISNPSSEFYYPALMKRYMNNDTTLTANDFFYLYYGYPTQENYKPLVETNYVDSLNILFSARTASLGNEFQRIEHYCKAILSVEPFNMRDLNVLAFAYQSMENKDAAAVQMFKLRMIENTIKSTGDGITEKSPWWIIYRNHAEDILNLMSAEPGRILIISSSVEFIACKKMPDKKLKGYYFNYSEVYKRNPDYIDQATKIKRKLEVNPNKPSSKYELVK